MYRSTDWISPKISELCLSETIEYIIVRLATKNIKSVANLTLEKRIVNFVKKRRQSINLIINEGIIDKVD